MPEFTVKRTILRKLLVSSVCSRARGPPNERGRFPGGKGIAGFNQPGALVIHWRLMEFANARLFRKQVAPLGNTSPPLDVDR
jgi:hypothetical protein